MPRLLLWPLLLDLARMTLWLRESTRKTSMLLLALILLWVTQFQCFSFTAGVWSSQFSCGKNGWSSWSTVVWLWNLWKDPHGTLSSAIIIISWYGVANHSIASIIVTRKVMFKTCEWIIRWHDSFWPMAGQYVMGLILIHTLVIIVMCVGEQAS